VLKFKWLNSRDYYYYWLVVRGCRNYRLNIRGCDASLMLKISSFVLMFL
jgi:hypothetical protein